MDSSSSSNPVKTYAAEAEAFAEEADFYARAAEAFAAQAVADSLSSNDVAKAVAAKTEAVAAKTEAAVQAAAAKAAADSLSSNDNDIAQGVAEAKASVAAGLAGLEANKAKAAAEAAKAAAGITGHLNIKQSIDTGIRCTLGSGEGVKYTDIPIQLVAVIVCNNTQENQMVHFNYAGQTISKLVASPTKQGFSMGYCYLINPSQTEYYDMTIFLSDFAPKDATVDVYLVSLMLPVADNAAQYQGIGLDGSPVNFNGYSRFYGDSTLSFNEYVLQVDSTDKGLVTLLFEGDMVHVLGVNMPVGAELNSFITLGPGTNNNDFDIKCTTNSSLNYSFYGMDNRIAFNTTAPTNATNIGTVKLQQS